MSQLKLVLLVAVYFYVTYASKMPVWTFLHKPLVFDYRSLRIHRRDPAGRLFFIDVFVTLFGSDGFLRILAHTYVIGTNVMYKNNSLI